ncbi:alpha/beta hydrolase [Myxococcota bacterium]|nr:alpha/beta hydrolase [Myxococcota bacterium]
MTSDPKTEPTAPTSAPTAPTSDTPNAASAASAAPQPRVAELPGVRLGYEARGAGRALTFLHGFTLDHTMWTPQIEDLARDHHTITYDRRGFGRSDVPGTEPYSAIDDARALLDHLGVAKTWVVGHSAGGHTALELALAMPERVAGLVLVCTSGLGGVPFSFDLMGLFKNLRKAAAKDGVPAAREVWKKAGWFAPARERPELRAVIDGMIDGYSGWHWTHEDPIVNLDPPPAARLAELAMPVLVVGATRDLPYNQSINDALVRGVRGAELVKLDGVGHMAGLEAPAALNAAIRSFLARHA